MPCQYCNDSHSAFDPCPESVEALRSSTYWLIERGSPAEWWQCGWKENNGRHVEHWTRDVHASLRFAIRQDAESKMAELKVRGTNEPLRITEHMDMGHDAAVT